MTDMFFRTVPSPRARGGKTTRHKSISRVDRDAGRHADGRPIKAIHGYMVRVVWKKQIEQKTFSDSMHGGRLGALAAAIEWRDAIERQIGKPRTNRVVIGAPNSNTGKLGIYRRIKDGREVFEVAWRDADGRTKRTCYSIAKHGERGALKLARQARQRGEQARLR